MRKVEGEKVEGKIRKKIRRVEGERESGESGSELSVLDIYLTIYLTS